MRQGMVARRCRLLIVREKRTDPMVKGIGVDIVDNRRIEKILKQKCGQRFLDRVYTSLEMEYCKQKRKSVEHFSARFAAKEAVFKALGTGWSKGIAWRDVEVRNDGSGAPRVVLYGKAKEIFRDRGGGRILLSLSHTSQIAVAQAVWVSHDALPDLTQSE